MSENAEHATERCGSCTAPMAPDQRYCLNCGVLRPGARRPLPALLRERFAGPGGAAGGLGGTAPGAADQRPSLAVILAGLACLLLAMGVGVLIGRSGGTGGQTPVTVAGAPAGAGATPAAAFMGDWPAGKDGWTIALKTLPKAATAPAAVDAAKSVVSGKGASAVGALDADAYQSLTAGSYVIYSGIFDTERAATDALKQLTADFPEARLVHVSATATAASSETLGGATTTAKKASTASSKKASAASNNTAKAFEDSKKAPKTVGTGGKPPAKDNKPAAGGGGFTEIK